MAHSTNLAEALGDCYVDPNCTDKRIWLRAINRFLNKSKGFNPNLERLNRDSVKYSSSRRWLLPFTKDLGWSVIDIAYFYTDHKKFIINCYNGGKEVALLIDREGNRHLIRRSGWYMAASEISERLGLTTLKKLYEIFVSDVISPTNPIRQRKMMNARVKILGNKFKNIVIRDKCSNNAVRLTWYKDFSYDKQNERIQYTTHTMLISPNRWEITPDVYHGQAAGYINCDDKLKQLASSLQPTRMISKDEAKSLIEEHYNNIKSKIDSQMECAIGNFN